MKDEQGTVSKGSLKSQMNQVKGEPLKPSPWCLFETIKGFVQLADIGRMNCINIT